MPARIRRASTRHDDTLNHEVKNLVDAAGYVAAARSAIREARGENCMTKSMRDDEIALLAGALDRAKLILNIEVQITWINRIGEMIREVA